MLLGTAMAAVGLNTSVAVFKGVGLKPFAVGFAGAVVVGSGRHGHGHPLRPLRHAVTGTGTVTPLFDAISANCAETTGTFCHVTVTDPSHILRDLEAMKRVVIAVLLMTGVLAMRAAARAVRALPDR